MIFVKNHTIPIGRMNPFVFGLNTSCAFVFAEKVLKRAEANDRLLLVGLFVGSEAAGFNELPTLKIDVAVSDPLPTRSATAGLKVSTSTFFHFIFLASSIGGEGFAEAHFGVPEKVRWIILVSRRKLLK